MGLSLATFKSQPSEFISPEKIDKPGNPGTFDEIHKKYDNLRINNFDGINFAIKKVLSNHFHVTHTFAKETQPISVVKYPSKDKEANYKFGASYIGTKRIGYTEKYPVVSGVVAPNGDLTTNFIHTLGCRCRVKLFTNIRKNKYKNVKASMEYRTDDFTLAATVVDPYILKQEGVILLHYLQAITSRIALGAELVYNKTSKFQNGADKTNLAGAFRYSTGFTTVSATVGQTAMRLCYHKIASRQLQMGVEFQSNFITKESKGTIIYRVNLPQADVVYTGFVDSNFKIGGIFEKKLYPIPEASLILSAFLDHATDNFSVGIGFNIG